MLVILSRIGEVHQQLYRYICMLDVLSKVLPYEMTPALLMHPFLQASTRRSTLCMMLQSLKNGPSNGFHVYAGILTLN
jgi:hypothetical protein